LTPDDENKAIRFDRAFEAHRPESAKLKPWDIRIDPLWNPRDMQSPETLAHIEGLKASIKARGILESVGVKYDPRTQTPTLVYGECRVTATRQLWDEGHEILVPAVRATGDEAELTVQNLVSNTGQQLRQDEVGASCKKLLAWGWTPEKIASHIGKPLRYVTDAIALVDTPLEAKRMIAAGLVTSAHVLHAVHERGDGAVSHLKEQVAARSGGTGKTTKPLPRPKAPTIGQRALTAADELCRYIKGNNEIKWAELQRLTDEYLALREPGGDG
jgi:ParB-like chromosome segregation protein Spo0J